MATIEWTGERMRCRDPLYVSYLNRGMVVADDGTRLGEVLELTTGYYLPSSWGIRADDCATATEAVAAVERLHAQFWS